MKNTTRGFGLFLLVSLTFASAHAQSRPLALVYKGPGACPAREGNCADAAAAVADRAGFDVEFVSPNTKDAGLFQEAAVYIQPGGNASMVAEHMTKTMKNLIRRFVSDGGGYVGFCAGGFYAMTPYDKEGQNRLGLIAGDAEVADFEYPSIVNVSWLDGKRHHVFWEGGAYFKLNQNSKLYGNSNTEVVSVYSQTRQAAGIRSQFGRGRVFVTGYHPEAPYHWRFNPTLEDADGTESDLAMAIQMVRWVANPPVR